LPPVVEVLVTAGICTDAGLAVTTTDHEPHVSVTTP
jgi:hypothetical protein